MREARTLELWMVVLGILFAHVLDILFYHPAEIAHRPWILLAVWQGLSSLGGFVGATTGAVVWKYFDVRRTGFRFRIVRRARPLAIMPFADVACATYALPFAIGRLGCALIHDHPGCLATPGSLFALAWPLDANDGLHHVVGPFHVVWGSTVRYDLGVLEFFLLVLIAVGMALTFGKRRPIGGYVAAGSLAYGVPRFALDFLRMTDGPEQELRHAGLTFAQWSSLAMIALGVVVAARLWTRGARGVAEAVEAPSS
jgi:phosphatidylglycerol:prolipoprotein diacylglycerol transferase